MGEVIGLFDRTRSVPAPVVAAERASGDIATGPSETTRPASDADRAQAALFAELLAEHHARIADALQSDGPSTTEQSRLDRAALRRELREVSAHLETIDRRST